ncbi:unnamed protein product [Brassicogethes aeneus]|uniref:Cytochrome P450 n=1 Tax=Brassicogethes aeneus TaxID=1431903 RepID=A0A9P0B8F3_BRAAE|nr:unnamed protein product [Brassicogethes aeneus]
MILSLVVLVTSFGLALWAYYRKKHSYWKQKGVPHETPKPIVGNIGGALTFKESIGQFLYRVYKGSNGPYHGFYVMGEPSILINDPDIIKHILIKDFNFFMNRTIVSDPKGDPISAHILFNSKTPLWNNLRRKVSPIFSSGKLKRMYSFLYESSSDLVNYLEKTDKMIESREVCSLYTTDIISSTCFGINAKCFENPNAEFRKISRKLFEWNSPRVSVPMLFYFLTPTIVKLFKIGLFRTECVRFFKRVFFRAIVEREQSKGFRNDFLDLLIQIKNQDAESNKNVKNEGDVILAQAIQFFAAGFETTSGLMVFFLYELAKNPDVQEKLRQEVLEVLEKKGEIMYDSFKDMKYLDMCTSEALRKYPILPFLDRRCSENYKLPGSELVLEKNTPVYISILGLQYDETYYPEPDKFIPERWMDSQINKFSFLAFGEGPRNCIGARFGVLAVKIGISRILSSLKVELCEKSPKNIGIQDFDSRALLLAPIDGIYLKYSKINK